MLWRWQELWREVLPLSKYWHIVIEKGLISVFACTLEVISCCCVSDRQLRVKIAPLSKCLPTMSLYINISATVLVMSILFASSQSGSFHRNRTKLSGKNGRYFSHVIKQCWRAQFKWVTIRSLLQRLLKATRDSSPSRFTISYSNLYLYRSVLTFDRTKSFRFSLNIT